MPQAWLSFARILIATWAVLAASACSMLPPMEDRAVSSAIADFESTPLAALVSAQTPSDGRSGFMLQPYGPNALATRFALARRATRSLDVQYYCYGPTTPDSR